MRLMLHRPPILDHLRRIILGSNPAHGGVMHFQTRACITVEHPSNLD
jgi:hypothetical protein